MISGKEKGKKEEITNKEILINKYRRYIILLKKYFTNWKNADNKEIKLDDNNTKYNLDKKEFKILVKKLIEKITLIKKIYIYLIIYIINNKSINNKDIIKKEEKNIENLNKEIAEIKKKLIIIFRKINPKNDEEIKRYISFIIKELNKICVINEQEIENYKEIYLRKKNKKNNLLIGNEKNGFCRIRCNPNLWMLIIPLFYIIYFLYTNDKSHEPY